MNTLQAWSDQEFEERLRAMGGRYHIHHPFQVMMHRGQLPQHQIQGWVANRYYYQINIPIKDAAILANCPEREVRRHWVQRILDHDGCQGDEGGIEAWIRLGEAVGLARADTVSQRLVLPGVRFAVDAYVNFARQRPWQEAAAASLTELFAPGIHQIGAAVRDGLACLSGVTDGPGVRLKGGDVSGRQHAAIGKNRHHPAPFRRCRFRHTARRRKGLGNGLGRHRRGGLPAPRVVGHW